MGYMTIKAMNTKSPFGRRLIYGSVLFSCLIVFVRIHPAISKLSAQPDVVSVGAVRSEQLYLITEYLSDSVVGWDQPIGLSVSSLGCVLGRNNFIRNFVVVSKLDDVFVVIVIRQYGNICQSKRFRMKIEQGKVEVHESLYMMN